MNPVSRPEGVSPAAGGHGVDDEILRLAFDGSALAMCILSPEGRIIHANRAMCALVARDRDDLMSRTWRDITHPDDGVGAELLVRDLLGGERDSGRLLQRFTRADGSIVWGEVFAGCVRTDDDRPRFAVLQVVDATGRPVGGQDAQGDVPDELDADAARAETERQSRVLAENTVRAQVELRGVIDSLLDPWVLLTAVRDEQGRITDFTYSDANAAACQLNGTTREELLGQRLLTLLPEHGPSGLFDLYARVVESGEPLALDDVPFVNASDGTTGRFDNRAVRVGDGISFTWRDVTDRYEARQVLRRQAELDVLTGVANRRSLEARLSEVAGRSPRTGVGIALLYCDIDHFKEINDDLGHPAGDKILAVVAERIGSAVREGDLIARQGGDEFVVLLEGVHGVADAEAVAMKVADAARLPVALDGRIVHPTMSIGIAMTGYGQDAREALEQADVAMYEAKRAGRNRVMIAHPD